MSFSKRILSIKIRYGLPPNIHIFIYIYIYMQGVCLLWVSLENPSRRNALLKRSPARIDQTMGRLPFGLEFEVETCLMSCPLFLDSMALSKWKCFKICSLYVFFFFIFLSDKDTFDLFHFTQGKAPRIHNTGWLITVASTFCGGVCGMHEILPVAQKYFVFCPVGFKGNRFHHWTYFLMFFFLRGQRRKWKFGFGLYFRCSSIGGLDWWIWIWI